MPTRSHALAAVAAGAAVLAVPAAASAAAPTVVAGPVEVKAYDMSVVASKGTLSVMLQRRAAGSTQTHLYGASKGVAVKVAGDLSRGTVKAPLGSYGTVKLELRATGALRGAKTPKGCTGSAGRSRAGVLTGTFKLKADGGRYFGTIAKRSLPAQVIKGGKLDCTATGGGGGTPGRTPGATMLSRSITDGDELTSLAVIRRSGSVTESVTRIDSRAATKPLQVMHMISAPAPAGAFSVADDLRSASVQGAGRFLTGSLSFAADDAFGTTAIGTASGSLTARFDPIGNVPLTAGDAPTTLLKG